MKLVVFDVDGVLTDGRLLVGDDGVEHKCFSVRDGHGIRLLQDNGVHVGVISGRSSPAVEHRLRGLGVRHLFQGRPRKLPVFEALLDELGLGARETACVGDDVQDLPLLLRAGLAVAVADAHPLLARHVHWHTTLAGGCGAAREVCDLVLRARGLWEQAHAPYLEGAPGGGPGGADWR